MSVELLSTRTRTANTTHTCIWCNESIPVKTRYTSQAIKFHGEFQFNRYHPECLKAMKEFFAENPYEEDFMPGEFTRGTTHSKL